MLVETHAHLDYEVFAPDFDAVLQRAREAGVTKIVTIATGLESSRRAVALAEKHPCVFAAVGIHPCHAGEEPDAAIAEIETLARHPRVVAVGEIGLDYFRLPGGPGHAPGDPLPAAQQAKRDAQVRRQKEVFRALLDVAARAGKNAVIHQRSSWEDTREILREYAGKTRGVLHCFGGTAAQAREMLDLGHAVSFTGIATFKNGKNMRDCAAALAPGEFFLETDCPYLAPEPFRGKRCEPAHTRLVAAALAEARGESLESLAAHTTRAAESFFGFERCN